MCVCVMYSFFSLFPFFDLEVISLVFNIYQQLNLKNNLSEQEEQRQNHGYSEHCDGCQMGRGWGGMSEEVRGLRSTNW